MRKTSLLATAILAAFLVVPLTARTADAVKTAGQQEIEESLTCQCGCGLTVASCNHLECSSAIPIRKDIAASLARGETAEQILARYKAEYGEKILSSPVPEGFNLLAWFGPYIAIVVAGIVMFTFLRRRAGQPAVAAPFQSPGAVFESPAEASGSPAVKDERLERLRKEVEDLER